MEEVTAAVSQSLQVRPFDFIRRVDPAHFLNFIQEERPQTIALVLSYLDPGKASIILQNLPFNIQGEVARRIAIMGRANPEALREVERVLEKKLSTLPGEDYYIGGVDSIVDILNMVDRGSEKYIFKALENIDPELTSEIKRRMFAFEDIVMLDDRGIQRVLREVDSQELVLALINADQKVQDKIFRNMSKRAGSLLKEEMLYMCPVRAISIEEARQKIVLIINHLKDSGEIVIDKSGVYETVSNPKMCLTFDDLISKMDIDAILEQIDYRTLVTALQLSPLWMYKKLSKSMPFFKRCKFRRDIRSRSVLFDDVENAREHIVSVLSSSMGETDAEDNDD